MKQKRHLKAGKKAVVEKPGDILDEEATMLTEV